jgi:predicted DNA-binding transcriptional regulator YafY
VLIGGKIMGAQATICQAIRERRLLQFYYDGGTRVVEPHQLAYNKKDNIALSAYWVRGYSESGDVSNRWREYLVDEMSAIVVLEENFSGPRPGYKRAPNKKYHSAICEL